MNRRRCNLGLAVTLALAVMVSCAPAAAPEGERVIKVGTCAIFTGPIATAGVSVNHGDSGYLGYINDHGGINGIEIKYLWEDTKGLVPAAITTYKRLKQAGVVAVTVTHPAHVEVLLPSLQKDEIPVVFQHGWTTPMRSEPIRWGFAGNAGYPAEFATFAKWLKENWTGPRPPKIGFIFYDISSGWDILDYMPRFAEEVGFTFVGHEVLPIFGLLDSSTEWLRLAGKEPDWVYVYFSGSQLMTVAMDSHRLEVMKQGINICGAHNPDEVVIGMTGADVVEGWYVVSHHPWARGQEDLRGMDTFFEALLEYRGLEPEQCGGVQMAGWLRFAVVVEAIRLAIEKVGFDNISGRAVRDALVSIKDFDTGLIPPITMSETRPYLGSYFQMAQIKGGSFTSVGTWVESPYHPIKK